MLTMGGVIKEWYDKTFNKQQKTSVKQAIHSNRSKWTTEPIWGHRVQGRVVPTFHVHCCLDCTSPFHNSYQSMRCKTYRYSVCVCLCVLGTYCKVMSNSCATPWTVAHQTPLSMESSRQEYWSGLPFPSPGDLPDPGIKPGWPALQILYCSLWEILDINKKPMHQKAWNYWPLALVCRMQTKLSIYKWQPTNKKFKTKKQKA